MKKLLLLFVLIFIVNSCKDAPKVEYESYSESDIAEPSNITTNDVDEVVIKESTAELKKRLVSEGYEIFDYVDEKTQDTILMQQYYIAFLKKGPIRNQNEEEAAKLQKAHMEHLGKMYKMGYADISGPFGDNSDISGITIYNVPTQKMADSLANADPAVKAGRLVIEIHPWWAAKGFALR